jgi:hypothetical protein
VNARAAAAMPSGSTDLASLLPAVEEIARPGSSDPDLHPRQSSRARGYIAIAVLNGIAAVAVIAILHAYEPHDVRYILPAAVETDMTALGGMAELVPGAVFSHVFVAQDSVLARMHLQILRKRDRPVPTLQWSLEELTAPPRTVRSGTVSASDLRDWDFVALRFAPLQTTAGTKFRLVVTASGTPAASLMVPLFPTPEPAFQDAVHTSCQGCTPAAYKGMAAPLRLTYAAQ